MELVNEQCRDQALKQFKLGNYVTAMRWYNTASARTLGHKKSDNYDALSRECAKLAGVAWKGGDYAKDNEAI